MEPVIKQKITQKMFNYFNAKTVRIVFALMCMMLASVKGAVAEQKLSSQESISEPLSEEDDLSTPTVFGGVGRKFATWQVGLDLLILSYPHFNAFRNRLNLKNHVSWLEWWLKDNWGLKSFYSEQSYKMFGPNGKRPTSKTNHIGSLLKTQHSLSEK